MNVDIVVCWKVFIENYYGNLGFRFEVAITAICLVLIVIYQFLDEDIALDEEKIEQFIKYEVNYYTKENDPEQYFNNGGLLKKLPEEVKPNPEPQHLSLESQNRNNNIIINQQKPELKPEPKLEPEQEHNNQTSQDNSPKINYFDDDVPIVHNTNETEIKFHRLPLNVGAGKSNKLSFKRQDSDNNNEFEKKRIFQRKQTQSKIENRLNSDKRDMEETDFEDILKIEDIDNNSYALNGINTY